MRLLLSLFLIAVASFLCPTHSAMADVISDNFHDAYNITTGAIVGGPTSSDPFDHAMRFSVSAPAGVSGYYLTSVDLPLEWTDQGSTNLTISVYNDASGQPGTPLETVVVDVASLTPTIITASFSNGVLLVDGVTYWVVVSGIDDSYHVWYAKDPITYSGAKSYKNLRLGLEWNTGGADCGYRVEGDPVTTVPAENNTWGAIKAMYGN